ncbi:hypothetical protein BH10PSE13_BH10PSE13_23780 [soil metagenome]
MDADRTSFATSIATYERGLAEQLGEDLDRKGLDKKHERMRDTPFRFLRATYWRWAETILDLCPDLADAPAVLAIGDTHVENFGTWRDVEGRIVWGANDFDEAAEMPYPLDLVRLATSAMLVGGQRSGLMCEAIETGYAEGLADPRPFILERDHAWLREAVIVSEDHRADFWSDLDKRAQAIPARFVTALAAAMPGPVGNLRLFPRRAGTGSLGRPRFVAIGDWQGGPVVREVKAILPPVWVVARGVADAPIRAAEIADGPYRAPDPHYRIASSLVVRRLSPNNRKIEVMGDAATFLSLQLLHAMGYEIGNCHAGDGNRIVAVQADMAKRETGWLKRAAKTAADFIEQEQARYRRSPAL